MRIGAGASAPPAPAPAPATGVDGRDCGAAAPPTSNAFLFWIKFMGSSDVRRCACAEAGQGQGEGGGKHVSEGRLGERNNGEQK